MRREHCQLDLIIVSWTQVFCFTRVKEVNAGRNKSLGGFWCVLVERDWLTGVLPSVTGRRGQWVGPPSTSLSVPHHSWTFVENAGPLSVDPSGTSGHLPCCPFHLHITTEYKRTYKSDFVVYTGCGYCSAKIRSVPLWRMSGKWVYDDVSDWYMGPPIQPLVQMQVHGSVRGVRVCSGCIQIRIRPVD